MNTREPVSLRFCLLTVLSVCLLFMASSLSAAMFYDFGSSMSKANDISGDGTYVAGYTIAGEAFRWDFSTAAVDYLGFTDVAHTTSLGYAISYDGSVITGTSGTSGIGAVRRAFRWVDGGVGMSDIGDLGGSTNGYAIDGSGALLMGQDTIAGAYAWNGTMAPFAPGQNIRKVMGLSNSGTVAVGEQLFPITGVTRAFASNSGVVYSLGTLSGNGTSIANGVSADGSAVVGQSGSEAFYFKDIDGGNDADPGEMIALGDLAGGAFSSSALDTAVVYQPALGRNVTIVVGWGTTANGKRAAAWVDDVAEGVFTPYDVGDMLVSLFGMNLDGWVLSEVTGISDDGMTITGNGLHMGEEVLTPEAWAFRVPEPITFGLLVVGGVFIRRRRA